MKRIIIADDSATARMFIRRCLEILGLGEVEYVEVEHGRDALAAAKEKRPDILLTDLNMPVMDGETLLKWVKSSPKLCEVPVIVITSVGNPAKEAHLLKLGARQVINKPVSPPIMMKALYGLLDKGSKAAKKVSMVTHKPRYQAMRQAVNQALENMAFTETLDHFDPDYAIPVAELTWTSLLVTAPVQGEIRLAMSKSLLEKLTATIYTLAPELISPRQSEDTLNELLNTIAGLFMTGLLENDQAYAIGLPRMGEGPLPELAENAIAWKLMTADEDPLQLFAVGSSLVALNKPVK